MEKEKKSLGKGIKAVFTAVVDWVATLFGMKDNSKYGRILHRIVGTAFAVVVVFWAVATLVHLGRNVHWDIGGWFDFNDKNVYFSDQLSDDISYYDGYYGHYGHLKNADGKKVLKHILNIAKPLEGDSLIYFSDGDKRGYFHMRDGRLVVKPIYEHAWIFSDGLAAVEVNGKVKFIDTTGRVVIDNGFAYDDADDGYVFHNGHCAVNDNRGNHMGLINRNGEWVLKPEYEHIYPYNNFWIIRKTDELAIMSFDMDTIFPLTKGRFEINDTAIIATYADHTQCMYDLQGRLTTANMIRSVEQLIYKTDEVMYKKSVDYNEEDESYYSYDDYRTGRAVASCLKYEAENGWYGLLSPDGRQLTPPSYYSIEAVSKDLYLCETSYGYGVMLNSNGRRIE